MDETRLIFPFSLKEREIEMKKRVYTLYRVSTKGQVEKDDIPMQKEACRNFAESQGWEIVKEFSEKGVSGFKKSAKDRDELQKIQQAAMEGKFDILLVFMFDRLGRRDDETPFIVEWFTKQGIEVWSVNEGQQRFDTHVDKLMNYIRYWQASGESLKTSVRTRTRLEQLTGEGHYTGGTVPFGYKRVRLGRVNKKNQEVCDLVIDEAEAEIVRLIFHKYVYEGYGAQKLSHYLYEQGVVGRNNKNIPNTSIVRMIKNKGYTGYLINGAVETECPQLRIIEPELFEQAQELRQARTCERGGTSLGTSSKALLTGLVYCGRICRALHILHQQRIVELLQITEEILFDLFLPGHIPVPDQAGDDGIDAEPVRNCLEIGAFCRNYPAFFLHMFSSFLLAGNAGLFRSGVSLFMVFAAFIYFLSYSVLLWTAHICFFQRASSHTTGHL